MKGVGVQRILGASPSSILLDFSYTLALKIRTIQYILVTLNNIIIGEPTCYTTLLIVIRNRLQCFLLPLKKCFYFALTSERAFGYDLPDPHIKMCICLFEGGSQRLLYLFV